MSLVEDKKIDPNNLVEELIKQSDLEGLYAEEYIVCEENFKKAKLKYDYLKGQLVLAIKASPKDFFGSLKFTLTEMESALSCDAKLRELKSSILIKEIESKRAKAKLDIIQHRGMRISQLISLWESGYYTKASLGSYESVTNEEVATEARSTVAGRMNERRRLKKETENNG